MNAKIIYQDNINQAASGISRLFEFLANKKQFPVPVKAAACISGVPEKTIAGILGTTRSFTDYQVYGNYIYLKEELTPPLKKVDYL